MHFCRACYSHFAGYQIQHEDLIVDETKTKLLGTDWKSKFKYGMAEVGLRLQLADLLKCEIVNIEIQGKHYSVMVPPKADHHTGKETNEDKKYKIQAEKLGVAAGKLKWVHLRKSDVRSVLVVRAG
ncbi:hypothetical protein RhiJN_25905 [Ceratobasidium sp. AG-Ba]|nr:hypothetical protein RhiJN_25905 [Ceratobasidium sp. AG-Ba]